MKRREILTWLAVLAFSSLICLDTWLGALWYTGARIDHRADQAGGFVALRLAPEAGISYQWSRTGKSVWFWRPGENLRLWPGD